MGFVCAPGIALQYISGHLEQLCEAYLLLKFRCDTDPLRHNLRRRRLLLGRTGPDESRDRHDISLRHVGQPEHRLLRRDGAPRPQPEGHCEPLPQAPRPPCRDDRAFSACRAHLRVAEQGMVRHLYT